MAMVRDNMSAEASSGNKMRTLDICIQGQFRLLKALGSGAFSDVYKGLDLSP
ncbi:hypothetical protein Egran_04774 [Elaphomyces granulatus]|uniref:Protein kinase domain-containing protein n=1 Tax=Elaphomyces granulatus TaxID=519963 RepID=A0A232LTG2_9EURO|nr:hypothetical protein Egran_04774 [Elaphomyces granulatus]